MRICYTCRGEGMVEDGLPTDDLKTCVACEGRGIIFIPQHIYLQFKENGETTWCMVRINDNDIEYQLVPISEE